MSHPQDLGLAEQARAIADGGLDPAELLDATLERLAADPLNATPEVYAGAARRMLAEAPEGPLRGVPLTMKDMFSLPWRGAHNGTRHELLPAGASGAFVRLRDAGAVIVGRAQQHELGLGTTGRASADGPVGNPHDPERCGGGSSGGSAAAVGARHVAGSIGSDSGGSTRLPAAWCGVVGLKVTWGAVPAALYTGAVSTFSAPGVFARSAADARLLASALLRETEGTDPPVSRLRVGLLEDPCWTDLQPAVEERCREALAVSGWELVPVDLPGAEHAPAVAATRLTADMLAALPAHVVNDLDPLTRAVVRYTSLLPGPRVGRAERVRALLRRGVAELFGHVDLLAWPTSPAVAPRIDDPTVELPSGIALADPPNLRQAVLANLTGVPGISVPAGTDPDGLPVGLQLLAPWGEEGRLLAAAEHLEMRLGGQTPESQR